MAHILLADDEADLADAIRRALQHDGNTVDVALDGADAIALMRSHQYDVIITDVRMPNDGGVVVSGMARMLQTGATVIAMSGYFDQMAGSAKLEFLQNLGVAHAIRKPVDVNELNALIRHITRED